MKQGNLYYRFLFLIVMLMPFNSVLAADKLVAQVSNTFVKKGGKISQQLLNNTSSKKEKVRAKAVDRSHEPILLDVTFYSVSAGLAKKLQLAGFDVLALSEKYNRGSIIQEAGASLQELAQWPEVKYINKELGKIQRVGAATSRAPVALKSNLISVQPHNLTGAGQVVGILSDSFSHTVGIRDGNTVPAKCIAGTLKNSKAQDSGDLPAEIDIRKDDSKECDTNDQSSGGTDEGAAMAELVHDIAPDAAITFSTVGESILSFALAIDDMCTAKSEGGAGATVVVDDIIFLSQLMYQDDIVSQAAKTCIAAGIPYFSAAGNNADTAFHMEYKDIRPSHNRSPDSNLVSGNDFHEWHSEFTGERYLAITVPAGSSFSAILQWNQPALSNPTNISHPPGIDLDLYLLSSEEVPDEDGNNILSMGIEDQAALLESADPVEYVEFENTDFFQKTIYLVVDHWFGNKRFIPQDESTALEFRLVFFTSGEISFDPKIKPNASTMYGHSNAEGVVSVAAIPWFEAEEFDKVGGPTSEVDPESFTALGGHLKKYFDDDGRFNQQTVFVPTLASIDGNNTSFFGEPLSFNGFLGESDGKPNFFGTSAAAPNAAAVAALLLQQENKTPAELSQILICSAQDVNGDRAALGIDSVTGAGLIDAQGALNEMIQPSQASQLRPLDDLAILASTAVDLNVMLEDSDRFIVSSQWQHQSGFDITSIFEKTPLGHRFIAPETGFQTQLSVIAYDQCGFEYSDSIRITVDGLPTARAKTEGALIKGGVVLLRGGDSSDAEGPITYLWEDVFQEGITIENATSAEASFILSEIGNNTIRLTVTDSLGQTDSETVTVYLAEESNQPLVIARSGSGGGLYYFIGVFVLLSFFNLRIRNRKL